MENGNNSTFTGGEGHHHKAAARQTRMTTSVHFQRIGSSHDGEQESEHGEGRIGD